MRFQQQRQTLPPLPGLHDYRAILHAHAEDSAHTGGTRPEMLADAIKLDGEDQPWIYSNPIYLRQNG